MQKTSGRAVGLQLSIRCLWAFPSVKYTSKLFLDVKKTIVGIFIPWKRENYFPCA